MRFHGLSAFPITPADTDGTVDTEALSRLLTRVEAAGVDSVGLLGSTGTYMYLDWAQRCLPRLTPLWRDHRPWLK